MNKYIVAWIGAAAALSILGFLLWAIITSTNSVQQYNNTRFDVIGVASTAVFYGFDEEWIQRQAILKGLTTSEGTKSARHMSRIFGHNDIKDAKVIIVSSVIKNGVNPKGFHVAADVKIKNGRAVAWCIN